GESTVLRGDAVSTSAGTQISLTDGKVIVEGKAFDGRVALLLRPEDLKIETVSTGLSESINSIPVTITEITYVGSEFRIFAVTSDGTKVTGRTNTNNHSGLEVGGSAFLTWERRMGNIFID